MTNEERKQKSFVEMAIRSFACPAANFVSDLIRAKIAIRHDAALGRPELSMKPRMGSGSVSDIAIPLSWSPSLLGHPSHLFHELLC